MIYAVAHPVALLGLAVGFVVGAAVHGWLQAVAARRLGRAVVGRERLTPDPRRHLDPYGTVAAVLTGVGWTAPLRFVAARRVTWRAAGVAVVGPLANLLLAAVGVAGYVGAGGSLADLSSWPVYSTLHGSTGAPTGAQTVLQAFAVENVAMAVLCVVPVPPLEAGQLAFARTPRNPGWARFAYRLSEENWGVLVLLLLLFIPLGTQAPALLAFVDAVGHALLSLAS